jgi:hypothetical protein
MANESNGSNGRSGGIPPELLLRRDRTVRFERGGTVYATDGRVGVIRQVVVDDAAGEVVAIVIEVDGYDRRIMIPPHAIDKSGGSAVFLTCSTRQFAEWMVRAPGFEPQRAAKADIKTLLRPRSADGRDPRRAVLDAGRDYVETAALPAEMPSMAAPVDSDVVPSPARPLVMPNRSEHDPYVEIGRPPTAAGRR